MNRTDWPSCDAARSRETINHDARVAKEKYSSDRECNDERAGSELSTRRQVGPKLAELPSDQGGRVPGDTFKLGMVGLSLSLVENAPPGVALYSRSHWLSKPLAVATRVHAVAPGGYQHTSTCL